MSKSGPLAGIRILDLSIAGTGPYAAALLADQGADVIKVEHPNGGDIIRRVGTHTDNGISAMFQMFNRGKRSIAIDLTRKEGKDIVHRLATGSDVVMQNWRPGVAHKLGVGYEDLRRDDLVYVSISGFGDEGPYSHKTAYDTVIQAYAGVADIERGAKEETPRFSNHAVADKATSFMATQAITAALLARERGHGGQHVRLSMLEIVVAFMWADAAGNEVLRDGDQSQPRSTADGTPPIRFLDGWGIACPVSDANFIGMCKAFGVEGYDDPRLATQSLRQRNMDLLWKISGRCWEAARKMTTVDAIARLEANGVPCGVVLSSSTLADDPHVQAVGLLEDSVHPLAGRIRQPRHPVRFDGTPARLGAPAPALGEHSEAILAEIGMTDQVGQLRRNGVIA